jgi:hypothetical protein
VFGVVELKAFELAVIVDGLRQVVDLAYFHWFDLELVVFTFTDDDALFVLLHFIVVIFGKLVFETHFIVIDNVMVVINLIVYIRLCLSFFLKSDY